MASILEYHSKAADAILAHISGNLLQSRILRTVTQLVNQRAENGGFDPPWLDFPFFGAPRFAVQKPQNLSKVSICRREFKGQHDRGNGTESL